MALTEKLQLLITLDAKGAVQGLNNVGKAAEQQLGKADDRMAKFGKTTARVGVGMVGVGALIGGALFKAAQASEDANLSLVKLNNSLKGNPRLAGESADAFVKLANSIQKKTAADADQIISGQSMLATFQVTGDQIRKITPLVVDYARKFGVDLVTANASVGKALDGQVGALKRNGVSIDQTLYKTDRFAAVQKALAEQVGGFAEAEGKTFAGSLERLKNQLGDITEGVGGGAVDAFTSFLGPVQRLTDAFGNLDPEVQSSIGKLGAFGAAGLVTVGATATVVGKIISMKETFASLAETAPRASKAIGVAGKALGALGAAAVAYELVQLARASNQVSVDVDAMAASLKDLDGAQNKAFQQTVHAAEKFGKLDDVVSKIAETNPVVADGFIKQAEAAGISKETIAELTGIVDAQRAADKAGAEASKAYGDEMSASADDVDELTAANTGLLKSMQDVLDATLAQFDSNLAYRNAVDETSDKVRELSEKQREGKLTAEELDDANRDLESSLIGQAAAAVRAAEDNAKAAGNTLTAAEKTQIYKSELEKLKEQFPALAGLIQGYIDKLNAVPRTITTDIIASVQERYRGKSIVDLRNGYKLDGTRAAGGPVAAMGAYLVGEKGPELFVPGSSGTIVPNGGNSGQITAATGTGPVNMSVTINVQGSVHDKAGLVRDVTQGLRQVIRQEGGNVQKVLGK